MVSTLSCEWSQNAKEGVTWSVDCEINGYECLCVWLWLCVCVCERSGYLARRLRGVVVVGRADGLFLDDLAGRVPAQALLVRDAEEERPQENLRGRATL